MSDFKVWFNDIDITQYLHVTSLDRGVGTEITNNLEKIGISDGKHLKSRTHEEKIIPMGFVLRYDLTKKRRELAGALSVDSPAKLMFSDEPDKYYLAVPDGDIPLEENNFLGKGTINWLVPEGVAYSFEEKSVTNFGKPNYLEKPVTYKKGELWLVADGDLPDISVVSDFKNKVAGSDKENPHRFSRNGSSAILQPINGMWADNIQSQYNAVRELDGQYNAGFITTNKNAVYQVLVSWNILESIKRAIPQFYDISIADLRDIQQQMTCNIWAKGSAATGDIVNSSYWDGSDWKMIESNTQPEIIKLSGKFLEGEILNEDGFAHLLVYSAVSDGTTASSVFIDYTNIEITVEHPLIGKLMQADKDSDSFELDDWREYTPDANVITIDYSGTAETYPTFQAINHSDNGFLGYISQQGELIQLGNPDDIDVIPYKQNEFVLREDFTKQNNKWTENVGTVIYPYYRYDPKAPNRLEGTYNWDYTTETINPEYVKTDEKTWGGPTLHRAIPATSEGDNSGNFTQKTRINFKQGAITELGRVEVVLQSEDDPLIAASVRDSHDTKNVVVFECWVMGELVGAKVLNLSEFKSGFYEIEMTRMGSDISFRISGINTIKGSVINYLGSFNFKYNTDIILNKPITSTTLWAAQFSNYKPNSIQFTDYRFWWINVDKIEDIPNLFSEADVVNVYNDSGDITLNDVVYRNIGVIGNEYFTLKQGKNQIQILWSDWAVTPDVTIFYRERWK